MLEPYEPAGTLGTSGRGLLLGPRVRTKQAEAALQVYAPKTWNSLPKDVRQASTLTMFKSRPKTVYLDQSLKENSGSFKPRPYFLFEIRSSTHREQFGESWRPSEDI